MMDNVPSQSLTYRLRNWTPYAIGIIGILISVTLWHGLMYELPASIISSAKEALPWIILVLGSSLTIVIAIAAHLNQISQLRTQSLNQINQDFKKEMFERMEAEESKQKLEKALLQGQKLQAMGTLAGGIAHDFNNILYAIIGYVEMAREDVDKNTLVHTNLGKVLEAAARGQALISRILAFSRRQRPDFKPIYCQETIESVLSLLRPTIPAGVTIIFHTPKNDLVVEADQTQLHQVIVNIINNAVDAMEGEGVITIRLQHLASHDELLNHLPDADKIDYCKIDITDNGHGMDQATVERIFEPFYTTKEVGKGTGLGLSTVHAIMKEHRGEIIVNSQLGHGTTFTLLLPEYKESQNGENIVS